VLEPLALNELALGVVALGLDDPPERNLQLELRHVLARQVRVTSEGKKVRRPLAICMASLSRSNE
jgi:hypothetical protein